MADFDTSQFYLEETPEAAPQLSLFDNPVAALTSSDWWLTRPSGEKITAQQAVAGPVLAALNGLTLNHGDELVAGAQDLFGVRDYDSALAEARGLESNFRQASPLGAAAVTLPALLRTPLPGGPVKDGSFLGNAGRIGLQGLGLGAVSGFGEGEGGFENRANEALKEGAVNAGISTALGVPLLGVSSLLGKFAGSADDLSATAKRSSVGARATDYTKSAREIRSYDIIDDEVESATKGALDYFEQAGKFDKGRDPQTLLVNALHDDKALRGEVWQKVRDFDSKKNFAVYPKFNRARKYVEDLNVPVTEVDNYLSDIDELEAAIKQRGKGKLEAIQRQKDVWGEKWDEADDAKSGFYRAVYTDLKNSIEELVPEVGPLNQELSKYKIVLPILKRGHGSEEAKNLVGKGIQALRTSGGFLTTPALIGNIFSGPGGAIAGIAGGATLGYLTTPRGQSLVGDLLKKGGKVASKLGVAGQSAGAALPRVISQFQGPPSGQKSGSGRIDFDQSKFYLEESSDSPSSVGGSRPQSDGRTKQSQLRQSSSSTNYNPVSSSYATNQEIRHILDVPEGESMADKPLLASLAIQESATKGHPTGNPNAIGPETKYGRAKGKYQFLDSTGKEMMQRVGLDPKDYNPFDADQQEVLANAYIDLLTKQFGSLPLALAAYNYGPGNVSRMLKKYGASSYQEIEKHLPQETRKYVPAILGRLNKDTIEV